MQRGGKIRKTKTIYRKSKINTELTRTQHQRVKEEITGLPDTNFRKF
jgi:hypothetical protein